MPKEEKNFVQFGSLESTYSTKAVDGRILITTMIRSAEKGSREALVVAGAARGFATRCHVKSTEPRSLTVASRTGLVP